MPAVSVPDLYINVREAISVLGNGFLRDQSLLDKCADRESLLSFYNELIIHTYRLIVTKVAVSKGVIEEGTTPASIGGLFSPDSSPHLHNAPLPADVLDKAQSLLTRYTLKNTTVEIPWEDMNPESLGMVYEMLMEITPRVVDGVLELQDNVKGNARKTSGSYYTPKCLVETTLKNSLDVVLAKASTVDDVLSLNIIDPACGSGNFLIGAVRRIVSYMESISPSTANTAAMVIKNCLYGIDLNRTAVEIAKSALWIEADVQGSSIDDIAGHIITGNSLVGIADLRELDTGIPNKAYKCLAGDDKASCSWLKSQNTKEKKQGKVSSLFGEGASGSPDMKLACKLYVSAYFADNVQGQCELKTVPTTIDVRNAMEGNPVPEDLKSAADKFANEYNPIHWPLVFPEIMRSGGFDAVIGNPPWERIKVSEKEFFAGTPVADEHNSSKRKKLIDEWGGEPPRTFKRTYYDRFIEAKGKALKLSNYFSADGHDHGSTDYRFPLTGHGDVNLYALFAEHCLNIAKTGGGE